MIKLRVYKKNAKTVIAEGNPVEGVNITDLEAGTVVKDGDYEATFFDEEGKLLESNRVPLKGFTVEGKQLDEPSNVNSSATEDGATVTSDEPK